MRRFVMIIGILLLVVGMVIAQESVKEMFDGVPISTPDKQAYSLLSDSSVNVEVLRDEDVRNSQPHDKFILVGTFDEEVDRVKYTDDRKLWIAVFYIKGYNGFTFNQKPVGVLFLHKPSKEMLTYNNIYLYVEFFGSQTKDVYNLHYFYGYGWRKKLYTDIIPVISEEELYAPKENSL